MAGITRSFSHTWFWPKRIGAGHHRFCKLCWKEESEQPTADRVKQMIDQGWVPGRELAGCCENNSSPSAMVTHLVEHHPEVCPADLIERRTGKIVHEPTKVDHDLMRDWATDMVLGSLLPERLVSDPNVRMVIAKRLKGLGGRATLVNEVDSTLDDIETEVLEEIREAQTQKCRFVISGDCWKPKMKRKHHYLAIYIDWTTAAWEHKTVCLKVTVMGSQRRGEEYRDCFQAALHWADIEVKGEMLCGLSDHEGAVRRGLRLLGLPLVGCACHALQLAPMHGLPPLRPATKPLVAKVASDDESSDSDDSDDSSGSDSASSASEAPAPRKRGREKDPDHVASQAELVTPFKKYRATSKWYQNHEDARNDMDEDAKAAGVETVAYQHETPCRWSTAYLHMVSVVRNNKAHTMTRAKRGTSAKGAPEGLNDDELKEAVHLCIVLQPLKIGTKIIEGDPQNRTILASMYLPVWNKTMEQLGARVLKVPTELRACMDNKKEVRRSDLCPLAKRLLEFLFKDLSKIKHKHFENTTGESLLKISTYLDPRFKRHSYATKVQLDATRADLKKLILETVPHYMEAVERFKIREARPENQILSTLASRPTKRTRASRAIAKETVLLFKKT